MVVLTPIPDDKLSELMVALEAAMNEEAVTRPRPKQRACEIIASHSQNCKSGGNPAVRLVRITVPPHPPLIALNEDLWQAGSRWFALDDLPPHPGVFLTQRIEEMIAVSGDPLERYRWFPQLLAREAPDIDFSWQVWVIVRRQCEDISPQDGGENRHRVSHTPISFLVEDILEDGAWKERENKHAINTDMRVGEDTQPRRQDGVDSGEHPSPVEEDDSPPVGEDDRPMPPDDDGDGEYSTPVGEDDRPLPPEDDGDGEYSTPVGEDDRPQPPDDDGNIVVVPAEEIMITSAQGFAGVLAQQEPPVYSSGAVPDPPRRPAVFCDATTAKARIETEKSRYFKQPGDLKPPTYFIVPVRETTPLDP